MTLPHAAPAWRQLKAEKSKCLVDCVQKTFGFSFLLPIKFKLN